MHQQYNLQLVRKDLESKLLRKIIESLAIQFPENNSQQNIQLANKLWKQWPERGKLINEYPFLRDVEDELTKYLYKQLSSQLAEVVELHPDYLQEVMELFPKIDQSRVKQNLLKYGTRVRSFPLYTPHMAEMSEYTFRSLKRAAKPETSRELVEAVNQQFFAELVKDRPRLEAMVQDINQPVFTEMSLPYLQHETDLFIRAWHPINNHWEVNSLLVPIPPSFNNGIEVGKTINTFAALGLQELQKSNNGSASLADVHLISKQQLPDLLEKINSAFTLTLDEIVKVSNFVLQKIHTELEKLQVYLQQIINGLTIKTTNIFLETWEQLMLLTIIKLGSESIVTKFTSTPSETSAISIDTSSIKSLDFTGYSAEDIQRQITSSQSLVWLQDWTKTHKSTQTNENLAKNILTKISLYNLFNQNDLTTRIASAKLG